MKTTSLIILSIWIALAAGWVGNIVKFASCDFEEPYKTEIIRGIGIPVAPFGAIISVMDIGEENQ